MSHRHFFVLLRYVCFHLICKITLHCIFVHWIYVCYSFVLQMKKYTQNFGLNGFPVTVHKGSSYFHDLDLNEKVQSRDYQPKVEAIHYLMNLFDKTQVQWFTVKTFNKNIMTNCARFIGGGLQVRESCSEISPLKNLCG